MAKLANSRTSIGLSSLYESNGHIHIEKVGVPIWKFDLLDDWMVVHLVFLQNT